MIKIMTAPELRSLMDRGEDFVLVNVLDEESFAKERIHGSYNVRQSRDDFVNAVEEIAGGKNRPVVVYCANKICQASPKAAINLERAGFTDVTDFEGGMAEWKEAGYEVETGNPSSIS